MNRAICVIRKSLAHFFLVSISSNAFLMYADTPYWTAMAEKFITDVWRFGAYDWTRAKPKTGGKGNAA